MFHHLGCTRLALVICGAVVLGGLPDSRSSASDAVIQLPSGTRMISYIESVVSKDRVETYRNKVYLAEDGRKRVEHLTAKQGLISIFDDWGIQRLILRSETKSASVWEEFEPFGQGPGKLRTWIEGFQRLSGLAETDLGFRKLDGHWTTGLEAKEHGRTVTMWFDTNTGVPVRIGIDDPEQYTALTDFHFEAELNEPKFSFEAPEGYNVVEVHRKLVE